MFKVLFFCFGFVLPLFANSLYIPEGNFYSEYAAECYKPVSDLGPIGILGELNRNRDKIDNLAKDSATTRMNSLECLSQKIPQEEEKAKRLESSLLSSSHWEDGLRRIEWRILLSNQRSYPFTPQEIESAKLYLKQRQETQTEIFQLSLRYLLEQDPNQKRNVYEQGFQSLYGSNIREYQKFLASLSLESYESYIKLLETREGKSR